MLQLMPGPNGPPKTAVGRQRTRAGVGGIASGGVGFVNDGKKSQGNTRQGRPGGGSLGLSHVLSGQADENIPNSLLR